MSHIQRCTQGHQWETEKELKLSAADTDELCPLCHSHTIDLLPPPPVKLPAPPPPRVAGYEMLEELGRGGMGVVYKGRASRSERIVALKMIKESVLAGPDDLARFRAEAQALARLQHPNIVQIYEVGEQDGRPFFALEYVAGASLDRRLGGKPLPDREAAELVETVARAVHAAHERGIIHRDLKPANILMSGEGRGTRGEGTRGEVGLASRLRLLPSRPSPLSSGAQDHGLRPRQAP